MNNHDDSREREVFFADLDQHGDVMKNKSIEAIVNSVIKLVAISNLERTLQSTTKNK